MRYNLYFDLSAILITLVILIAAKISKWIPTFKNRSYRGIVLCVFLTAVSDFVTCSLEMSNWKSAPWYIPVRWTMDTGYHLFHIMSGVFFVWFTASVFYQKITTMRGKAMLFGPVLFIEILLGINLFVPLVFYYDASGGYQRGPLMILIYIAGIYYLGLVAYLLFKYRHKAEPLVVGVMGFYCVMAFLGIAIQTVYPAFMIGEFFNSLALIMMYVNVEPAGEIKDEKYEVMTRRAYLSRTAKALDGNVPVLSIFIHVSDMHETAQTGDEYMHTKVMKQIIAWLKRYKKEAWLAVWDDSCIILDMIHFNESRAEEIMSEIEERFRSSWKEDEFTQTVGMTAWMVRCPEDVESAEELAEKTNMLNDIRLHRHRGITRFSEINFEELGYVRRMMDHAVESIRRRTAQVRYEPVFDVRNNQIISARAVIFFPDGTGSYTNGNAFVNPASSSEALASFDEYSFSYSVSHYKEIMKHTTLKEISTRLAPAFIANPGFEGRLKNICERSGADYRRMMLRISDGTYAQLSESQLNRLKAMREEGWLFAIDDFGMGQSFLSRLTDSGITIMIMHKTVTQSILESQDGIQFGKGIIKAIHGMNKTVTMTGIQNDTQAGIAKEIGADFLCGPFLSEPMMVDKFCQFMKAEEPYVLQ